MSTEDTRTVVVVPCFNERQRIDEHAFLGIASTGQVRLLFVDDGSTDGTGDVLARLSADCEGIEVFTLASNTGKAEAVRRGLVRAVRAGATTVGYFDADLATPPSELLRLTEVLQGDAELVGVFGSRVARLGSAIERKALRHYLGRAYATAASMALGVTVYDTQCGAKVFRVNGALAAALAQPFRSTWAFDVELLYRLLKGGERTAPVPVTAFVEVPLDTWHDVRGSKLRVGPAFVALLDLARIARRRVGRSGSGKGADAHGAPTSVMAPQLPGSPRGRRPGGTTSHGGRPDPGRKEA